MANSAQARKRARQAAKHRAHNAPMRSTMRTARKKVVKAIEAGDREAAIAAFRAAEPVIDRMARKGIIHRNTAARQKSRLSQGIRKLGA